MSAIYASLNSVHNAAVGGTVMPALKAPPDQLEKLPDATSSWQIASAVASSETMIAAGAGQFWRIKAITGAVELAFGTAAELASPPDNGEHFSADEACERSASAGQTFAYRLVPEA